MSYENPRIRDLSKPLPEIMIDFADGDPGAITALMELVRSAEAVDPDSAFGPFSPLFLLDNLDCYGSRIWMFYKDVCGHNVKTMHSLMRANQLGFVSAKDLSAAIDNRGRGIDVPALVARVKERLPLFDIGDAADKGQ